MTNKAQHWDGVYGTKDAETVSWYQDDASTSIDLIGRFGTLGGVVDVGAGASVLADQLLKVGRTDLTLLDVSAEGLDETRRRLGGAAETVTFIVEDLLRWQPERTFAVWHDRAVFHFLTTVEERDAYVRAVTAAVSADGVVVIGTFAEDGPEQCSGLPTARYEADGLTEVFSPAFTPAFAAREVHQTPWGSQQPFTWVVLRRSSDTEGAS